jgi:hypothetical protein
MKKVGEQNMTPGLVTQSLCTDQIGLQYTTPVELAVRRKFHPTQLPTISTLNGVYWEATYVRLRPYQHEAVEAEEVH